MRMTADPTALQGILNVWSIPNNHLKVGPWVVKQPRYILITKEYDDP